MEEYDGRDEVKAERPGLKRLAADAVIAVGGLRLGRWMTRRIPRVLLYHRFGLDNEGRRTSADAFEQHVMFLKRHCHVISMAELGEMLKTGKKFPDNVAVITVDDGYRDFYANAFPILRRHNIPATFYVTTGFVDRELWLWPDKVEYVLENTRLRQWPLSIEGKERFCSSVDGRERRKLWVEICQHCLSLGEQEKNDFLADLARRLEVKFPQEPPANCEPASWQELREMSECGIEIGAHTITHARLVKIPEEQLANEIVGSKHRIEEMIERPVVSFAYPNGGIYDYNARTMRVVENAGFLTSTVAFPEAGTADRFEVGRFSIGSDLRDLQIVLSCRGYFDRRGSAEALRAGYEF